MTDRVWPEPMNDVLEQTLTVYGKAMSAQFRDTVKLDGSPAPEIAMHHYDGAYRSTEDGHPYMLPVEDAILLRDMLNAATDRGELPSEMPR